MRTLFVAPPSVLLVPPKGNPGSEAISAAYAKLPNSSCMQVVRMGEDCMGVIKEALRCAEEVLVLYDTGYARSAKFRGVQQCLFLSGFPVRWAVGVRSECHLVQHESDRQRAAHLVSAFFCHQNFMRCLGRTEAEVKPHLPWGEMGKARAKALGLDKWETLSDLNRWFRSPL